jgi:hypothetical protein
MVAMNDDLISPPRSTMYVDVTPDGDVVFSNVAADGDDPDTRVIFMTPATAYRLAQMLITAAESVESPGPMT